MFKTTFKTIEELQSFLQDSDFKEVKFCVEPDYIDAIIGISDEGKIVYDFDKMVEHLAKIYEKDENSKDPYTDAIEWIDYNCQIPNYWEIVYSDFDESLVDYGDFGDRFTDYRKTIIGFNTYGTLLIDSEYVNHHNIDEIETLLKEYEINYKII